jgi:hypothetical protein
MNLEKTYKNKAFIDVQFSERVLMTDDSRSSRRRRFREKSPTRQVDILKRALTACCKNTDFSDTIAVDGVAPKCERLQNLEVDYRVYSIEIMYKNVLGTRPHEECLYVPLRRT